MNGRYNMVCMGGKVSGSSVCRLVGLASLLASAGVLTGCLATTPSMGGGSATAASGSAAGASAEGANAGLEKCKETLGTLRIEENTSAGWYTAYSSRYRTGSTVPALRLLVQQSNCFVIVERGRAMQGVNQERTLSRSDEGRAGSQFGGGQMVAADYTMSPEILLSDRGGSKAGGLLSGLRGVAGTALSAVAGSMSTNEAATILLLIDNRSSVQISAAEGYSKNIDFGLSGWGFGGGAVGGASAFTSTPEGKVLMAAFADSYNKMVVALRNYKAQTVKGGLGTGGRLGVSGGSTNASREVDQKAKKP